MNNQKYFTSQTILSKKCINVIYKFFIFYFKKLINMSNIIAQITVTIFFTHLIFRLYLNFVRIFRFEQTRERLSLSLVVAKR